MIKYHGRNEFGKHWSLTCGQDVMPPRGDLEIAIVAGKEGVTFGGLLIKWDELEEAKKPYEPTRR